MPDTSTSQCVNVNTTDATAGATSEDFDLVCLFGLVQCTSDIPRWSRDTGRNPIKKTPGARGEPGHTDSTGAQRISGIVQYGKKTPGEPGHTRSRKVRGEDRERPYRVESWVVGARACLPSARKARSKVGESAPVVSVTSRITG